ncbi:TonB-dependent siderophore receptor [Nostoc sp. UIC 10607]|uniref:TonB-dependent siderophore receptor n=1 Tax=Nostoc sp. UIC 10607 TaxID=3045935 RepID=UPI0039A26C2C
MKLEQLLQSLLLTSSVVVLVTTPANSEEIPTQQVQRHSRSTGAGTSSSTPVQLVKLNTEIPQLSEIKPPLISADKLVQSPTPGEAGSQNVVEVTGVKINPIDNKLEIILETPRGEQLQVTQKEQGNTYIADIPSSQLRLPSGGNTFRQENPVAGITEVTVTNVDANSIRVTVIGEAGVPVVELFDSDEGLIFGLTSVASSAQTPQTPEVPQQTPQTSQTPEVQPTPQPETQTEPSEPAAETEEPIELVVTGEQDGYKVPNASSATRTDTPIRDTPASIQVIPQQVLKDQQVLRLPEALRNISGYSEEGGFGDTREQFSLRGFSVSGLSDSQIFQDGFRVFNQQGLIETANLERIEILKGPASILFGSLEPGGIVNLVTKRPLAEPYYGAELSIGSDGFVRPTLDVSGPLNTDKTALYRLNTVYETGRRWRGDFDTDISRFFIAPVVDFKLGDRTEVTLDLDYLNDERPFDRGLIEVNGGVADIPRDRLVLSTPKDFLRQENLSTGYRLSHQFNDDWTIRNAFRYSKTDYLDYRAEARSLDDETGELSGRYFFSRETYEESYGLQTDVVGKFTTGSVKHTLVFGVDLTRNTSDGNVRRSENGFIPSINIFNPVYPDITRPNRLELNLDQDYTIRTDRLGIFLQDQIAFTDNLKILIGGRFDSVDFRYDDPVSEFLAEQSQQAFSPRVGIVYQPIEPISLYANFTQSFNPNYFDITADGSPLEPSRATQYEVGIKGELFDGRLAATLAAYQITKTNIPTTDPDNEDFSVAIGEARSRGIELDITGEILPGWKIIASYGYTDAIITEDQNIVSGTRLANVPRNAASLWTNYEFQQGSLEGLGFGFGIFYVDQKFGDDTSDPYFIPSYIRTDAAIYYRRNTWRAGINIKNLFDVTYFESGANVGNSIEVGAPLTVIGTLAVEF